MILPRRPTGFDARALPRAALPILLACAADAFAAHPLLIEDTATQGAGKFELELGNAWTRDGGARAYEFGPQLSYGVLPNLDGILRPTWISLHTAGDGTTTARGAGDTAVDVKWRFYEAGAVSVATRAGIDAPTGNAARGLGAGRRPITCSRSPACRRRRSRSTPISAMRALAVTRSCAAISFMRRLPRS
jgi:hypothetical protein